MTYLDNYHSSGEIFGLIIIFDHGMGRCCKHLSIFLIQMCVAAMSSWYFNFCVNHSFLFITAIRRRR